MQQLKKLISYLLFVPFVIPLLLTPSTFFPYHFGKTIYFQIFISIVAVIGFFSFWKYKNDKTKPRLLTLDVVIFLFLLVYLVAALFGANPLKSFWGDMSRAQGVVTWIHFGLFYWLLRVYWKEECLWMWANRFIMFVSILVSFTALFQDLIGPNLGLSDEFLDSNRMSGIIGNPAFLGAALFLPFIISVSQFIREKNLGWKSFALVALVIDFLGLYSSQTRSVAVAFAASVLFFAIALVFSIKEKKYRTRIVIPFVAVVILILGSVFYMNVSGNSFSKSIRLLNFENILDSTSSDSTRIWAWNVALKGIKDRPVLGWGPENFDYPFDLHYDPRFFVVSALEATWDKPHNFFLEVGVGAGVLGILSVLALVIVFASTVLKVAASQSSIKMRIYWIVIFSGVFGYFAHLMFLFENSNTLSVLFYIFAFTAWGYSMHQNSNTGFLIIKINKLLSFLWPKIQKISNILFFVFLLLVVYFVSVEVREVKMSKMIDGAADAILVRNINDWERYADKALSIKVPNEFEKLKFLTSGVDKIDKAGFVDKIVLANIGPRILEQFDLLEQSGVVSNYVPYFLWRGQLELYLAEHVDKKYYDVAESSLGRARELSPLRQDAAFLVGRSYLLQNEFDKALALHRELVVQNNTVSDAYWLYGLILISSGDREKGLFYADKALHMGSRSLKPNNVIYLAERYAEDEAYDKMISLYEHALTNDSLGEFATIYARLAAVFAEIGQNERAIFYLEQAVAIDPTLDHEAKEFINNLTN